MRSLRRLKQYRTRSGSDGMLVATCELCAASRRYRSGFCNLRACLCCNQQVLSKVLEYSAPCVCCSLRMVNVRSRVVKERMICIVTHHFNRQIVLMRTLFERLDLRWCNPVVS